MSRPKQATLGARDQIVHESSLGGEIDARWCAALETVQRLPQRRAAELRARFPQHEHHVTRRGRVTRHRAVDPRQETDHPHHGGWVHGAGRALVVERDVAAGHRRPERPAGVGDAAAGLAELVEDLGALRAAEVEAVGDSEGAGAGAGDVAGGFCYRRLPTLVWVEPHVAAVAVYGHRDPELGVAHADYTRVAAGPEHRARLDRRVILLVDPARRSDRGIVE